MYLIFSIQSRVAIKKNMKIIFKILTLLLLLTFNRINAQCGLTANYSWLSGPCDTLLHNVSVNITGSPCTSFSFLWENGSTAMSTQLDTGYHYIYITDCFGCETIDTFFIGCAGWSGTTNVENIQNKIEFKILPNTSSELINIIAINQPIEKIFIYNTTGILVKEYENINVTSFPINIADFKSGLFFLKVKNGNNYYLLKFIKT